MRWMAVVAALAAAAAEEPLFRVVDLDVGTAETVRLPGAGEVTIKLTAVRETRDRMRSAIRSALVDVEINGARTTLACGNYNLPVAAGGVQADCAVTRAYYSNARSDQWGLVKQARIRVWPAGSPWMPPGSFVYPARQLWFATNTQMANEPTFVDDGITFTNTQVYYHGALDIGGAEGMVDVLAATEGEVVSLGRQTLPEYRQGDWPVESRHDHLYVRDSRGWLHCYVHLISFDPSVRLGERVRMGQKIGTLGKEGSSGGWAHLHYEILGRQPSGKWGMIEGYAFLWEAWQREQRPELIAVARPHVAGVVGEKVVLDGTRSWSRRSKIVRYEWTTEQGPAAASSAYTCGPATSRRRSRSPTTAAASPTTSPPSTSAIPPIPTSARPPSMPPTRPPWASGPARPSPSRREPSAPPTEKRCGISATAALR